MNEDLVRKVGRVSDRVGSENELGTSDNRRRGVSVDVSDGVSVDVSDDADVSVDVRCRRRVGCQR